MHHGTKQAIVLQMPHMYDLKIKVWGDGEGVLLCNKTSHTPGRMSTSGEILQNVRCC